MTFGYIFGKMREYEISKTGRCEDPGPDFVHFHTVWGGDGVNSWDSFTVAQPAFGHYIIECLGCWSAIWRMGLNSK